MAPGSDLAGASRAGWSEVSGAVTQRGRLWQRPHESGASRPSPDSRPAMAFSPRWVRHAVVARRWAITRMLTGATLRRYRGSRRHAAPGPQMKPGATLRRSQEIPSPRCAGSGL